MQPVPHPTRPAGSWLSTFVRPAGSRLNTLGAVLVGGASRRFGSDKASADWNGGSLLDNALGVLANSGVRHLVYVGGEPRNGVAHEARHVADLPDIEPCALRGVLTALDDAAHQRNRAESLDAVVMLACDIPLVSPHTVLRIAAALGSSDAAVASGDRNHWSCLALRTSTLPAMRTAYDRGVRALHEVCSELNLARVTVDEREFVNVNDPTTLSQLITERSQLGE